MSAGQVRSLPNGYTDAQTVGVVTRQHGAAQLGKTFAVNARATLGGKVGGATFEGVGEQTTTRVNIFEGSTCDLRTDGGVVDAETLTRTL